MMNRNTDDAAFLREFGQRLRSARQRVGLTQGELARILGKTQNLLSKYEGGLQAIRITELPELARVLGVPVSYFFGDTSDTLIDAEPIAGNHDIPPLLQKMVSNLVQHYYSNLQPHEKNEVENPYSADIDTPDRKQ